MERQELIKKLEGYREWIGGTRTQNPIELGFSKSGIDEMLKEAVENLKENGNENLNDNDGMTLNEYQDKAMTTCMETCFNYEYMLLNLVGEVGELCGKIAKHLRKGEAEFWDDGLLLNIDDEQLNLLKKELGDVLWQTAGVASVMGCKLEDIAKQNLEKLASRKERGVIDGNGDVR